MAAAYASVCFYGDSLLMSTDCMKVRLIPREKKPIKLEKHSLRRRIVCILTWANDESVFEIVSSFANS